MWFHKLNLFLASSPPPSSLSGVMEWRGVHMRNPTTIGEYKYQFHFLFLRNESLETILIWGYELSSSSSMPLIFTSVLESLINLCNFKGIPSIWITVGHNLIIEDKVAWVLTVDARKRWITRSPFIKLSSASPHLCHHCSGYGLSLPIMII